MYNVGDTINYQTANIRRIHFGETLGIVKTGVVEEAFHTIDGRPCYWIEGEKELILQKQILNFVAVTTM